MRTCPANGVDTFAQFNSSTAVFQDNVQSYSNTEPAIDLDRRVAPRLRLADERTVTKIGPSALTHGCSGRHLGQVGPLRVAIYVRQLLK